MGDYHFIVCGHKIGKNTGGHPPPESPKTKAMKMKDIVDYKNH
jgi:hypothetical protein